jgi:hypothetical protein
MESLFWYGDLLENSHLDDEEILGNNIKRCSVDLLQGRGHNWIRGLSTGLALVLATTEGTFVYCLCLGLCCELRFCKCGWFHNTGLSRSVHRQFHKT